MKKLGTLLLLALFMFANQAEAQRYLEQIFTDVDIITDITYGNNITVLTVSDPDIGVPTPEDLKMDLYMPAGDTETNRPVIINIHTGNFLPQGTNGGVNGQRVDSVNVEIAMRFAKMGYVVANIDYRLGWNPFAPTIDGRVFGLINAAYRGIQDARTCIRFFRKTVAEDDNLYGVDGESIALWGVGTGGYIVYGAATIDSYNELLLPKFFDNDSGMPMVIEQLNGDPFAVTTTPLCTANWPSYSSDFDVSINMGGAIGDTSWITANDAAMISFQVPDDPFAPYEEDILTVPTTGDLIVEVQGAKTVQTKVAALGLNQAMIDANISDEFTDGANANNMGLEGLYPLLRPCPPSPFPPNDPACESGPWEWWNAAFWSQVEHPTCMDLGLPVSVCNFHVIASINNQDMSATKGRTYVDTIVGYAAPRMYYTMGLNVATTEIISANDVNLSIAPNPSANEMRFTSDAENPMETIEIYNFAGQLISSDRVEANNFVLNRDGLSNGMYLAKIQFEKGIVSKKVVFN